MTKKFD